MNDRPDMGMDEKKMAYDEYSKSDTLQHNQELSTLLIL